MSKPGCKLVLVAPVEITPVMMTASNVPEDDYPEWAPGTYAKGDRVIVLSTHSVYQSAADANTDSPIVPTTEPKWLRVGATNRWRAYDDAVNTQTTHPGSITYTLQPGVPATRLTLLNLTDATSVRVRVTDPVWPGVYERTITLGRQLRQSSWWNYYFGRRAVPTQADFDDLPGFTNPTIEIEILGGPLLAVGVILVGEASEWGLGVRMGARVGTISYSRRDVDQFGNITIQKRASSKRTTFSMVINRGEVDALQQRFEEVESIACLWVASDAYEATTIYGYYWNFEILLSTAEHSEVELELRGLT